MHHRSSLQAYDQAAITEHFNSTWTSLVEDCGNIDDAVADAAVGTGSLLLVRAMAGGGLLFFLILLVLIVFFFILLFILPFSLF